MRVVLLVALVALAGCLAGGDPFRTIAKGGQSGIHEQLRLVITESSEWQRFWTGHTSNRTDPPPVPRVDFKEERIVAILLGAKPNSCHGMEIGRVVTDRVAETTTVLYGVRTPGPADVCAQVITYPHHIIAIPNAPTEVQFEEVEFGAQG